MNNQIEIKDSKLCVSLESLVMGMSIDQKREMLAWLATDDEVVRSVVSHIVGEDDLGWSSGDPSRRQEILAKIEDSQIVSLRYNWKPWDDLRQKLKDIRSAEQIYWAIYHKIDQNISRPLINEFSSLGIESNYTTEQADADVEEIKTMIESAFNGMKKQTEQ